MPDSFIYWSEDPATVLTVHGNRGDHAHIVEHYFCYGYDEQMRDSGKVAFNTEPVGGGDGVSVGQVNDPELLCGLTAAALLGGQGVDVHVGQRRVLERADRRHAGVR